MADESPPPAKEPHYVRGTVASKVADGGTSDQDRVRNAFHPCSFTSIRSLEGALAGPTGLRCGKAPALFSEFEYISDPYSLADELQSVERKEQLKRLQEAGAKPFVAPGDKVPAKYEGTYEYISEPYDQFRDAALRQKWLEEKKVLAGPFLPPGAAGALEKPTRAMLTDMLTHIYRILCEDWEEAQPTVFTTQEDIIVVYFNLRTISNTDGIKAYMNVLAQRNESLAAYQLSKVAEGWGMKTEDNHLMFALRPPWVKSKAFGSADNTPGSSQQGETPHSNP